MLAAAVSDSSDSSDSSDDDAPSSPPPAKGKKPAAAPEAPRKAKAAAPAAEPEKPLETLKLVTLKGVGKVLQTSDKYLFKTTEEAGVPGAYLGRLKEDGSVDKDAENPFDAV